MPLKHRIIAIYLPQFHPFKENNEWWGKGFTEWTNVVKARPRFTGHYQPHLPSDLGFYDLRVPEVRIEQARMARENGIYGFCYYHYWFNGHLLMERPIEDMLNSKEPNFPFMICWANENWTRVWDGGEKEILIKQNYSFEDDLKHIKYLMKFLKDPRYIKINGKPVLSIYRTTNMPNIEKTIRIWKNEALKENIELYVCRFESFSEEGEKYLSEGIDAAIQFPPHNVTNFNKQTKYKNYIKNIINKIYRKIVGHGILPDLVDYKKYIEFQLRQPIPSYKYYPCICPMWDNSPRRKYDYFVFYNNSPVFFGIWLKNVIEKFNPYSSDENLIFINAWNEWAEGNYLEPDIKWEDNYLNEIKRILLSQQ
jgi:lipopolysaccharide biosynthesis protein